jgi:ribosomal protein S18 acetylase RimI-like enzyme
VCSDECIIGAIVLNDRQDEQYLRGDWRHNEPAAVVHRLCIDPACQQKGYGMQAMQLAEAALKEQGYRSVRLDAFSQNPYALRLYERLGYRRAGEALYRKGLFYLLEKCL